MLHVPVKEIVQDASIAKERIVEGGNVWIHLPNGDALQKSERDELRGKERRNPLF
ncbi:MAG: hypothetical protein ACLTS1_13345 [Coprococcus sp.]